MMLMLIFVAAAAAVGMASGTAGAGRFDLSRNGETALMGAVIDIIYGHPAELPELFGQVGMHADIDVI